MTPDRPVRVMFLHGLESGPRGGKVQLLADQGLQVTAPDQQMSVMDLRRRNSVARRILALPDVVASFALGAGAAAWATSAGHALTGTLGVTAVLAAAWPVRSRALIARGLRHSLDACTRIAADALGQQRPDVVLGSSWGGVVALELVLRGAWDGPLLLLAPAQARAWARMQLDEEARLRELSSRLRGRRAVAFHAPNDAVIPYADSLRLRDMAGVELRTVEGGGHRLMGVVGDGTVGGCLRELA